MANRIATASFWLTAGAAALVAAPAQATFPGINGRIVFVDTGPSGIHTVRPDGSDGVEIVMNQAADPDVSPDGTQVAFLASGIAIYIISIEGGPPEEVSGTNGVADADPVWTPDGKTLVFRCASGLCKIRASGGTATPISGTQAGDDVPDVHPDGDEVAFVRVVGGFSEVFTIPLAGGSANQRTNCNSSSAACDFPSYSPDGLSIALETTICSSFPRIAVISSSASLVTPSGCMANSQDGDGRPSFSPDGTEIAVAASGEIHRLMKNETTRDVVVPINGLSPDSPDWAPLEPERRAPEALCGKAFFDALRKAEVKKVKIAAKFVKADCGESPSAEALGTKLEEQLAPIIDKFNATVAKDRIGGEQECDPDLQALLPLQLDDLLDGEVSGVDYLFSQVEETCNGSPVPD